MKDNYVHRTLHNLPLSSAQEEKLQNYEDLLSNFIEDISLFKQALDAVLNAFSYSDEGRLKFRPSDRNLMTVLAWYAFYNDDHVFPEIIKFLGGHNWSRKHGVLQSCNLFYSYLVSDPDSVRSQLEVSFADFYDIDFVRENLLPRYQPGFIQQILKDLDVKVKNLPKKMLTVPKEPNLNGVRNLEKFEQAKLLKESLKFQPKPAKKPKDIPLSTYLADEIPKPQAKKPTSAKSMNFTPLKPRIRPSSYNNLIPDYYFQARDVPNETYESKQIKATTTSVLRELFKLKQMQKEKLASLLADQYASKASYETFQEKVLLNEQVKQFEKQKELKIKGMISFENAIIKNKEYSREKQKDYRRKKEKYEREYIKFLKENFKKLIETRLQNQEQASQNKQRVKLAKENLMDKNQEEVKSQIIQMKKLFSIALKQARKNHLAQIEKNKLLKQSEEDWIANQEEAKKKSIDFMETSGVGLLSEMCLAEVRLRKEFMDKKHLEMIEEMKSKNENKKLAKKEMLEFAVERIEKIKSAEKAKERERKASAASTTSSLRSHSSEKIESLQQELFERRQYRMRLQAN